MRVAEKDEKTEKLCNGFSLLDEKEQEYIFGILQALLFAKKKTESANASLQKSEDEKQGLCKG